MLLHLLHCQYNGITVMTRNHENDRRGRELQSLSRHVMILVQFSQQAPDTVIV